MDFIKVNLDKHDLFINALLCGGFEDETIALKARAYAQTLDGREQKAFASAINRYLLDAEFFNKRDMVSILTNVAKHLS
ncbi:MAG: hypothetical protein L0154_29015 [Chloroflexi bacterium]|nr:hypothetical protein [Chloroflexota bacterium]